MPSPYDVLLSSMVKQDSLLSEQKQAIVAEKTLQKRQTIDPNYEEFNPDLYEVVDGDTVRHRRTGKLTRFQGPEGSSMDTFETSLDYYDRKPSRARYHRESYAQQFGRDPDDVSNEDLVNAGLAQKQRLTEQMEGLRGKGLYRNKDDIYGRSLSSFEDPNVTKQIQPYTAGYFSPSNYEARLKAHAEDTFDIGTGDRSNIRAWTGDLLTNVATGGARIANEIAQAASVITGVSDLKPVQEFFQNNRGRIDSVKEALVSEEQLWRERADKRESEFLAPLYNAKKLQYMEDNPGSPEWEASLAAGTEQFLERIEYLLEEPGRILDATMESLPYMIGVGAIGRAATMNASRKLQGNYLKHLSKKGTPTPRNVQGRFQKKPEALLDYIGSTAYKTELKAVSKKAGITAVGLSEGLSTSADVYSSIVSMTEEQASESDAYLKLRARGLGHQAAVNNLARGAFTETLFTVTVLAGLASAVTGAGAFEGQLFHSLGQVRKEATKTWAQKAKDVAISAAGPGARETVEETIQSGGGEFLSQLAKFEATGEEVGPGVGTAAGEGAVVGLASGVGFSQVSNVGKAVKFVGKKGIEQVKKAGATELGEAANVELTPSDPKTAQDIINRGEQNGTPINPQASVESYLDAADAAGSEAAPRLYPELAVFWGEYNKEFVKQPVTPERLKTYNELQGRVDQYKAEYALALEAKARDITDEQLKADPTLRQWLKAAQTFAGFKYKTDDRELGEYLSSAREVDEAIAEADKMISSQTGAHGPTGKPQAQVLEEKMGDSVHIVNGIPLLGLLAHKRVITEAINAEDKPAYQKADFQLAKFINSQTKKFLAHRALLTRMVNPRRKETEGEIVNKVNAKYGTNVSWHPSAEDRNTGTALLVEELGAELQQLGNVRASLAKHALKAGLADSVVAQKAAKHPVAGIDLAGIVAPIPKGEVETLAIVDTKSTVERSETPIEEVKISEAESEVSGDSEAGAGQPLSEASEILTDEPEGVAEDTLKTEEQNGPSPVEAPAETKTEGAPVGQPSPEATPKAEDVVETTGAPVEAKPKTPAAEVVDTTSESDGVVTERITSEEASLEAAAAQFEAQEGTEADLEPEVAQETPLETPEERLLELRRELHKDLTDILELAQSEQGLDAADVSFSDIETQEIWDEFLVEAEGDIALAAQNMIDWRIQTHGDTITEAPSSRASALEEDALLHATETLALTDAKNRLLEPAPKSQLGDAVDFLSDTMVKHLSHLVGVMGNPLHKWTDSKLNNTRKAIQAKFKTLGLPTQILKALTASKKNVGNLLLAVPGTVSILRKSATRAEFYKEVKASVKERQGMNGVLEFTVGFVNELNGLYLGLLDSLDDKNTTLKRSNTGENRIGITNPLQEYLFQFLLDENGGLRENIASIMGMEMGNWIAGAGIATLNHEEWVINSLMGRNVDTKVTDEDRAMFGNGTLHTRVVEQLGLNVIKEMNLALKGMPDLTAEFTNRLAISIGNMMTATAVKMGRIQITPIHRNNFETIDESSAPSESTVNLIYSMPIDHEATNYKRYKEIKANTKLREDYDSAKRILGQFFSVESLAREPHDKPQPAPEKIKRGFGLNPAKLKAFMVSSGKQAYGPSHTMLPEWNRWSDMERFLSKVLGQVNQEDLDIVIHADKATSVASQNERNIRSYQHVAKRLRDHGNKLMYFSWNLISSHRSMIDSNTINPAADKLHRVLFGMRAWNVKMSVNPNPKGEADQVRLIALKTAVALAFDVKVDTLSIENVLAQFEAKLQNPTIRAGLDVIKLGVDTYTEEQEGIIGTAVAAANADERAHGWAGLTAWADFERAQSDPLKRTVTISLPMESDGKTNGFASLLMQIAPKDPAELRRLMPLYNAVGIYFKGGKAKNFPEFIEDGGVDAYESTSDGAGRYAQNMRAGLIPKLEKQVIVMTEADRKDLSEAADTGQWDYYYARRGGLLEANKAFQVSHSATVTGAKFLDFVRAFAKGPLIMVAYAAGMVGIRKGLVAEAIEEFYEELAKAGSDVLIEGMSDKDIHAVTAGAIAQVLHRFNSVAVTMHNSRSELKPKKILTLEETTQWLESTFPTLDELIFYRRNLSTREEFSDRKEKPTHLVITAESMENYSMAIDLIFGHALQAALEDKLKLIKPFTDKLNDATYWMNLIFTEKFRELIEAHSIANGGRTVVDQERRDILNQMIKDGLVPMVKTPLSDNQLDSLELTNYGTVSLTDLPKGRAYFGTENGGHQIHNLGYDELGNPYTPALSESTTGHLRAIDPNMDIGVAAIAKAIHSSDGAVNGKIMGNFAVLNLFDAEYGNFEESAEVNTAANKGFYNTHKGWNMGQEFSDTLDRLTLMMAPGSSRLSSNTKDSILVMFQEQRAKFANNKEEKDTINDQSPKAHFESWLTNFKAGIADNNEGRELLYETVGYVNQFAQANTEYDVARDDRGPSSAEQEAATPKTSEVIDDIRHDISQLDVERKSKVTRALINSIDGHGKSTTDIFMDWFAEAPAMEDVLDVVFEVLQFRAASDEDIESLRLMINTIRPMMNWEDTDGDTRPTQVMPGSPEDMGRDDGRYYPTAGLTKIRTDAKDIFSVILHEAVHAANVKQLKAMDPDSNEFKQLLKDTKDWARGQLKAPEGSPELKAAVSIRYILNQKTPADQDKTEFQADKPVRMISEYVAHLNSELTWTDDKFSFHFYTQNTVINAAQVLIDSTRQEDIDRVFYSSEEAVDTALFDNSVNNDLTRESMAKVFGILRDAENTPVNDEVRQLFDKIISEFLGQGLDSIDALIVKIAESPDAVRNIGALLEKDVLLQATAKNYYSSNVDMSLEEVAIHEIAHAIFKHALGTKKRAGSVRIQKDAERLFLLTRDKLAERYGGLDNVWKAFLPNPVSYSTLDEELAKTRYNHIFESGDLHEFMAMGVSNPQFLGILQGLDNTDPKPLWEGQLVKFFFALFNRAIQMLKGEIFTTHPRNISGALQQVAADIITVNNKEKERAIDKLDAGAITSKVGELNDATIRKLASLTQSRLAKLARQMSKSGQELSAELKELSRVAQIITSAKSAVGSLLSGDVKEFRKAYEAAVPKQDYMLAEMVTEVLPWADRNLKWVDFIRKTDHLIDSRRQQQFEHTRAILHDMFENMKDLTTKQREALTTVMMKTDLPALLAGEGIRITMDGILDLLLDPKLLDQRIKALESRLEQLDTDRYVTMFNKQSIGLANMMMTGTNFEWMQMTNIHNIVKQYNLFKPFRRIRQNHDELISVLEHLTTLRALKQVPEATIGMAADILEHELNRGEIDNGFSGMMGIIQSFKAKSQQMLFAGNPTQMWKGYIYEIFDEEVHIEAQPYSESGLDALIAEMAEKKYEFIDALPRDPLDKNPVHVALFKTKRGIAQYSAAGMSLTGQQKRGMGMYESAFLTSQGEARRFTAGRTHSALVSATQAAYKRAEAQFKGGDVVAGVKMVPVLDTKGNVADFRYIMSEENKKKHLKKRDYFDEVLPRMVASIEDRTNSATLNEEAIEGLHKEWIAHNNNPESEARFVAVGRNVPNSQGKEMWNLLPKATQIAVKEIWGDDLFYVRDDAVNLVLGFRKMSFANNKFLAPMAPSVRFAEKIWQEIIQWERFRIAVLNPVVSIGNMVSNTALLLSQNIPANYIIREAQQAILGMRKYQKDIKQRNQLEILIQKRQVLGESTRHLVADLVRIEAALETNPVHDLVEEGLFTSIVEEFGLDEHSTRRKLTTKITDKIGGATGSKTALKLFQEAFMIPGSETGQLAMLATQYGDFVGRFVQFKWDTQVNKMNRDKAIHRALDTFIYYNIPQNRVLQAMNDNGLLMFTKFFFRIQPIIARTFKENPVNATVTFGLQGMVGSRIASENIANYALMNNFTNKFQLTPWDHITDGDIFMPMSLKWLGIFYD